MYERVDCKSVVEEEEEKECSLCSSFQEVLHAKCSLEDGPSLLGEQVEQLQLCKQSRIFIFKESKKCEKSLCGMKKQDIW